MKDRRPLALKYRPQTFSDLVGNEVNRTILLNTIIKDKVRYAYFFNGGRGSGKTTASRIFAKAINCLSPVNGEPCNRCESCKLINDERNIDVIEIDAASENSVEAIRALSSSLHYAPAYSKRKVVILDECHQLSSHASNALLKILEEPPEHVVFIFCTTDPQRVLETIKSRCMVFQFQRLGRDEIVGRLRTICNSESIRIEPSALELIATIVNGAMRDAITILDQASIFEEEITHKTISSLIGHVSYEELNILFLNLKDVRVTIEWIQAKLSKSSASDIINSILQYLELLMLVQQGVQVASLSSTIIDKARVVSGEMSFENIVDLMAISKKALLDLKRLQVHDSSILLVSLVSSFKRNLEGKQVSSGVNLIDAFRGVTQQVSSEIDTIKQYFSGRQVEV